MCHFIILVAPGDREAEVAKALETYQRTALRVENSHLTKLTPEGSAFFLTTNTCDCGTVLGRVQVTPIEAAAARDKERRRLRKKGWSEAKIERSLANKEAGLATTTARRSADTFELWSNILSDLTSDRKISHVGLFLHVYEGSIEGEPLEATIRRAPAKVPVINSLRTLVEDELIFFK